MVKTRVILSMDEICFLLDASREHVCRVGWSSTYENLQKKLNKVHKRLLDSPTFELEELKKIVPEHIKAVLEREGVLDAYLHNIVAYNSERSWKNCAMSRGINGAFIWERTPEGFDFWYRMSALSVAEERK